MSLWVSFVIQIPPQVVVAPLHQGAVHPTTASIQIMGPFHWLMR